ncbi:MAG TPA: response regulator transcription factor [Candidatus Nitrosotenuis sp.]|nr:response regulator transcription factor [Candidatus Nitrosotenuis sp.]
MRRIRVVIADDSALFRQMLVDSLEEEEDIEVVGQAADGQEAIDLVERTCPDIILLDVKMPRVDGVQATREIVRRRPRTKVVILTAFEEDEYIFHLVRAGATGYLLKETPIDEVVRAIHVAHSDESLIQPRVANKILRMFAGLSQAVPSGETSAASGREPARALLGRLTEREIEVLSHIGRGLNNKELAQALVISETTVKSHVANIMNKLDLRDRVEMVLLAVEAGLVQRGRGRG